jgi:hypothetical protein
MVNASSSITIWYVVAIILVIMWIALPIIVLDMNRTLKKIEDRLGKVYIELKWPSRDRDYQSNKNIDENRSSPEQIY